MYKIHLFEDKNRFLISGLSLSDNNFAFKTQNIV